MQTDYLKIAMMGGWILGVSTVGYMAGAASIPAWIAVAAVSVVPPVFMARLWSAPAPSLSESIRNVLR